MILFSFTLSFILFILPCMQNSFPVLHHHSLTRFSPDTELWRVAVLPSSVPTRLSLGWVAITGKSAQDHVNPGVSREHSAYSERHMEPSVGITSSVALPPKSHCSSLESRWCPGPQESCDPSYPLMSSASQVCNLWSNSSSQLFSPLWWDCHLLNLSTNGSWGAGS